MSPRFRSAAEAEAYVLSLINYEVRPGRFGATRPRDLEAFRARLLAAGWRPGAFPTVHVGGTNGKGSVATLLERLFRAEGERTGLYTSPHLQDMRERIRMDGTPVGRRVFRDDVSRLAEVFTGGGERGFRTTFELLTALAFMRFQHDRVDRAVIEVGLGGRLDATNVLPAGWVVLTPVGLDHRHVLGNTLAGIARDKGRIIKPGGGVILLPQPKAADRVLRARARRVGAPVIDSGCVDVAVDAFGERGTTFSIRGRSDYGAVATGLWGAHQVGNVAGAVAAAECALDRALRPRAVARALRGACVPGRLEPVDARGRSWLLDVGHNPGAARGVRDALARHAPGARVTAVVGMAADKDMRGFLAALDPAVDRFVFTAAASPRAAGPSALRAASPRPGRTASTVSRALDTAAGTPADLILVTGSFLVVGEARTALGLGLR